MRTALELIEISRQRLQQSGVYFGHGTDNADDEAAFLVLHALGYSYDTPDEILNLPCSNAQVAAVERLITQRIDARLPSAYLTNRMWFAGLEFFVDGRVLVPRSPIAELILKDFSPWFDSSAFHQVLEIGTGSGCIAIALAHYLPHAEVTATDISADALNVAQMNLVSHPELARRVRFEQANLFPAEPRKFDLIVSNPPYVPSGQLDSLPAEYRAEPRLALAAGEEGLDLLRPMLSQAAQYLSDSGVLMLDVGDRWQLLEANYPSTSFVWCELENGGEGVGFVAKEALCALA